MGQIPLAPASLPDFPAVPIQSLINEAQHLCQGISRRPSIRLDRRVYRSFGRRPRSGATYQAIASPIASLAHLLGYYAFARQGAERAGYNLACVSVLSDYIDDEQGDRFWADFPNWDVFHKAFVAECDRRKVRQNQRLNPGLIRDLYGIASRRPQQGLFHTWAEEVRRSQSLKGLFTELVNIHGIKDKIASFVCRDVVFLADLEEARCW